MLACSSSESCRTTLAGDPIARDPDGIRVLGVTKDPAAMMLFLLMMAPSIMVARIPIRHSASTLQAWMMAPCPIVTSFSISTP